MEEFDFVVEKYSPMITRVLKQANIYKNHDYYRQCATIALWQAWRKYDENRGPFAPYAYRTMLTTIYTEMRKDNAYTEHHIATEKDDLVNIAQYYQVKNEGGNEFGQLEELLEELTKEERDLIYALYLYGETYEEIAEKTNKSVASLKKRRQRIMNKLRQRLAQTK